MADTSTPASLSAFWDATLERARRQPLDAKVERLNWRAGSSTKAREQSRRSRSRARSSNRRKAKLNAGKTRLGIDIHRARE